jgi:glycosyltransferase involved in cell wall biosynthesis
MGLQAQRVEVAYDLQGSRCDAVLVIGGTRALVGLWRARRQGIPVVQRLDGFNWIHRRVRTGARHHLRAELNNRLLRLIRGTLSDHIIYQSAFARDWWRGAFGRERVPASVVHNAVPLDRYTLEGPGKPPDDRTRVAVVEGNFSGGYEIGVGTAVALARRLAAKRGRRVEVTLVGHAPERVRARWSGGGEVSLEWRGLIPPEEVPSINRSSHLLYAADLNPACPNTVIEALACGLPVLAFDTGALREIVSPEAGRVVDYGGDPWRLDRPDLEGLAAAAGDLLERQAQFRAGARARAEARFGLDRMVAGYLEVFSSFHAGFRR